MRRHVLARRSGIALGVTYVLLGVAETIRLVVTGDGGFFFWFGTLVGGGTLLLLGALPRQAVRGGRRLIAVLLGAALGIPATAWTLVVPILALTVIVSTLMSLSDTTDPAPGT
ncbi:MAG: hypothetical protein ABI807_05475 [Sporichthyaceae bacterium]